MTKLTIETITITTLTMVKSTIVDMEEEVAALELIVVVSMAILIPNFATGEEFVLGGGC